MKHRNHVLLIRAALALFLVFVLATAAPAQDRGSKLRTVKGFVVDPDDNPVPGGRVYLKNLKSLIVKTYIADDKGAYRFSGLDPNVDYEIHAEANGMSSNNKTISYMDGRTEIDIHLKLNKKK